MPDDLTMRELVRRAAASVLRAADLAETGDRADAVATLHHVVDDLEAVAGRLAGQDTFADGGTAAALKAIERLATAARDGTEPELHAAREHFRGAYSAEIQDAYSRGFMAGASTALNASDDVRANEAARLLDDLFGGGSFAA